jgi:hypothetical protein
MKNTEALVVVIQETGLEVNACRTKYIVSRSECRTKSQYKVDNSSFERVENFKYWEQL